MAIAPDKASRGEENIATQSKRASRSGRFALIMPNECCANSSELQLSTDSAFRGGRPGALPARDVGDDSGERPSSRIGARAPGSRALLRTSGCTGARYRDGEEPGTRGPDFCGGRRQGWSTDTAGGAG